ncbi:uncharacterized protein LOC131074181 [Cryptomeria japonica]|uniref:uncharacterized protein LOC131074181 n=1 Tax=Cryptomeria japonica TaxID=3369 RepID=UPI0027DA16ED|nr:uncharacterized protein LOC131074181 [Cryptomeria japonica]
MKLRSFLSNKDLPKEAIEEAREKYEAKRAGASSTPTSTSIGMKTRSVEVKKEKLTEAKKEKPSKIQFKRKGKVIEHPTPKAPKVKEVYRKRKKGQAKKLTADGEEETESEGEKKALRASGKNSKVVGASTVKSIKKPLVHIETEQILKKFLGLIPDEEEEQPEKFKVEDLLDDVDIDVFSQYEIVFTNQSEDEKLVNVQSETAVIPDDDTEIDTIGTKEENKYQIEDIQVEGVQMTEQREREPKRG